MHSDQITLQTHTTQTRRKTKKKILYSSWSNRIPICSSWLKFPLAMATNERNTQQQITSDLMRTKRWDALICLAENFILFHSYNSDFLITGHRWQNIILLTITICFAVHQFNSKEYRDQFMLAINKNKLVARAILQMAIDVAYSASRSFVAMTIMKQNSCGL